MINKKSTKKLTTKEFIERAKKVHGDKYSYDKVNYINNKTKVCIICPKHGEFWQTPESHLVGEGCRYCARRYKKTTEDFIREAIEIHGVRYDYSKVDYKSTMEKVIIICPKHGEFLQTPSKHLTGQGCPNCRRNKKDTTESFIEKAKKVHGNCYDYDNTEYVNNWTKLRIICPEHGEFWQTPNDHLDGCGCPMCKSSKLEKLVRDSLKLNNIIFEEQKNWDWLIYKSNQYVDFFLPEYNIAIECQGLQHFEPVDYFGGELDFLSNKNRDKNKLDLCNSHGIKVLYYSNLGDNYSYPYEVFTNIDDLINEIKKII